MKLNRCGAAESADGKYIYLAVFNLSDSSWTEEIDTEMLPVEKINGYHLENVGTKKQHTAAESIKITLEPHASVGYKIGK